MKKILLLDVDGVLGNWTQALLDTVYSLTGHTYSENDVIQWDAPGLFEQKYQHIPEFRKQLNGLLDHPGWTYSIEPYPGVQEAVEALKSKADIFYVTSPSFSCKSWVHERMEWLKDHFGANKEQIIFTASKYLVFGDVFVDDKPEHIHSWNKFKNHSGQAFLLNRPYNQDVDLTRINSLSEINRLF